MKVAKAPAIESLETAIGKATFTGKGDRDTVMHMLKEFNTLLGVAATRTGDAKAVVKARRAAKKHQGALSRHV